MTEQIKQPLVADLNQHKDEFWWIHPAMRAKQSLPITGLSSVPEGGHLWVRSDDEPIQDTDQSQQCMPIGQGDYADFAKVLYKLNGYRPGPVRGWYVVVCVEVGEAWAVAQLRADTQHPLQVFSDLVFESEELARDRAMQMRRADPGACRESSNSQPGRSGGRNLSQTISNERKFQERLSGQSQVPGSHGNRTQVALSRVKSESLEKVQESSKESRPNSHNQSADSQTKSHY